MATRKANRHIYLLLGENEIEKKRFIDEIIKKEKPDEVETIFADEVDTDRILEKLSGRDIFFSKKVVIVHSAEKINKKKFVEHIKDLPDTTILIMTSPQNPRAFDREIQLAIEKIGVVKTFWSPFPTVMKSKLLEEARRVKLRLEPAVIDLLMEKNGTDLTMSVRDLEQLASSSDEGELITLEKAVSILGSKPVNRDVFALVDAVMKGEKESVYRIWKELVMEGEHPLKLIKMIERTARLVWSAKGINGDKNEIKNKLGITSKMELNKVFAFSQQVSENKLRKVFHALYQADRMIKSGKEDLAIVEIIGSV